MQRHDLYQQKLQVLEPCIKQNKTSGFFLVNNNNQCKTTTLCSNRILKNLKIFYLNHKKGVAALCLRSHTIKHRDVWLSALHVVLTTFREQLLDVQFITLTLLGVAWTSQLVDLSTLMLCDDALCLMSTCHS